MIFCLLSFLRLVVAVTSYALLDVLDMVEDNFIQYSVPEMIHRNFRSPGFHSQFGSQFLGQRFDSNDDFDSISVFFG